MNATFPFTEYTVRNVDADFEFYRLVIILNYYFQFIRPNIKKQPTINLINSWLLSIVNIFRLRKAIIAMVSVS